ncbi:translation initiation factor IF-2-like [Balaenoptera musculus]|uniref:Translation initiation factor IF-2-like n=1 Tax=Balaenoptera musculus TaxID=9771 RepID=A0A8B8Z2Z9_BALMU|nr:translation initiation factor IF-2-like [Balaenoptera musculus]
MAALGLGGARRGPQAPSGLAKPRQREPGEAAILLHCAASRAGAAAAPRPEAAPAQPWESGDGREGGGRARGWAGVGAPGRRLRFSCSAAQPGPRLAASPVPLRSKPGPVNTAPARHQPGLERGHPKIHPPVCPLRNHPRAGGRCARLEGGGGGGGEGIGPNASRDEAGRPRCARLLCDRLTAEPAAPRPPPPAPHRPRTQTPLETRLPAPPPPGLYSFPAPTPLPGRRATAGQPRPPGLGPRPSSRRPGASPGDSPSSAQPDEDRW